MQDELDYTAIREKFKNGDWVFGIGEFVGCSLAFDLNTSMPQPFSYLGTNDASQFRIATTDEIREATEREETKHKPNGFYILTSDDGERSLVLLHSPYANDERYVSFGHWDGNASYRSYLYF